VELRRRPLEAMVGAVAIAPGADFWRGRRVLVTGHTGFKGSWLTLWLHRLGAELTGISLPPETSPNLFSLIGADRLCDSHFCDIRDLSRLVPLVSAARAEIVLHLAAQPLVRASYRDPLTTFTTNVIGSANLLEALRGLPGVKAVVMVTTDKVYRNVESDVPYTEADPLGGHDPYSASKAACEIVVASYRDAFLASEGVAVATARAGNVIGGGDWSQDRLVPDAVRAWLAARVLSVRHPDAVRAWQHVLEPLAGYLSLAHQLTEHPALAGAYNFGPDPDACVRVRELLELARAAFGGGAITHVGSPAALHETGQLLLDPGKAAQQLGVGPRWPLAQSVERTMRWYRAQHEGESARALCEADITAFEAGS
jgi:CDP-glucose 4,6-dehydratase